MSKKIIRVVEDLNGEFQVQVAHIDYPTEFTEWRTFGTEAEAKGYSIQLKNSETVKRIVETY